MENPFTKDGLVWAHGQGMFLFDGTSIPILTKPIFNFQFHALYCEPTLCKRVVNDKDYELTPEEITEISEYIAAEKLKPQVVNGVDANGKFYRDVDITQVIRVVKTQPPEIGMWRLDPNRLFEKWVQVYPVDKDGYLLDTGGIIEDTQLHKIIWAEPPFNKFVKKWKWDFLALQWVDGETYENKIKIMQERLIEEFRWARQRKFGDIVVTYKGIVFAGKGKALDVLLQASNLEKPIEWYPKGAIEPITLTSTDIKEVAKLIFDEKQKLFQEYFAHKKAILTMLDEDELMAYETNETNGKG